MHFDPTINLGSLLLMAGGVVAFFKVFLGIRDTITKQVDSINRIMDAITDHENRLRYIEGVTSRVHSRRTDMGVTERP